MAIARAAKARSWGLPVVSPLLLAPALARAEVDLFRLFGIMLRIGAVLYGSGYVLLAFARSDLVEHLGWLTQQQLVDAVAVGQMTPGPLFTTATFIGYVLGGVPGALLATLGIFLPSFAFVALTNPLVARLRRSDLFSSLLDGVNAAALALMAGVTLQLGRAALTDVPTVALCAAATFAAFRFRFNNAWLIAVGGAVGLVLRAM